jgi:lysophospholipase L1-like esterase
LEVSVGLVAVGDSIINGHGDSLAGVPALSWAQWLAEAMDLSFTRYARGGARSGVVVDELLPRVRRRYRVGALSIGTNDVIHGLDLNAFRANVERAADALARSCDRVVVLSVPSSASVSRVIGEVAAIYGLTVVDAKIRSRRLMSGDGLHPNALGHLELADRAAEALGAAKPSILINRGPRRLGVIYWVRHWRHWAEARVQRVARAIRRRFRRSPLSPA